MKKRIYISRVILNNLGKDLGALPGDHLTFDHITGVLTIYRNKKLVGASTKHVSKESFKSFEAQGWILECDHTSKPIIPTSDEDDNGFEEVIEIDTPIVKPPPAKVKKKTIPDELKELEEEVIPSDYEMAGEDKDFEISPILKPKYAEPEPLVDIEEAIHDEVIEYDDNEDLPADWEVAETPTPKNAKKLRTPMPVDDDGGLDEFVAPDEPIAKKTSVKEPKVVSKPASERKITKQPRIKR